jgi:hypothetical protein
MSSINQAKAAAARILGCYDTITATDPKVFAAGLVDLLAMYPPPVVEKAADPARGIPAFVAFPNLAKFREQLERIFDEHDRDLRRERYQAEREIRKKLPEPMPPSEAERAYIIEGFRKLRAQIAG